MLPKKHGLKGSLGNGSVGLGQKMRYWLWMCPTSWYIVLACSSGLVSLLLVVLLVRESSKLVIYSLVLPARAEGGLMLHTVSDIRCIMVALFCIGEAKTYQGASFFLVLCVFIFVAFILVEW